MFFNYEIYVLSLASSKSNMHDNKHIILRIKIKYHYLNNCYWTNKIEIYHFWNCHRSKIWQMQTTILQRYTKTTI